MTLLPNIYKVYLYTLKIFSKKGVKMWYLLAYAAGSIIGFFSGIFLTVYFYEKYYDVKPRNGGY